MEVQERLSKYNLDSAVWGYIEEKYYSLLFLDENELSSSEKGMLFEIARYGINAKNLTVAEYFVDKFSSNFGEVESIEVDESIEIESMFYNTVIGSKRAIFKVKDRLLIGTLYESF